VATIEQGMRLSPRTQRPAHVPLPYGARAVTSLTSMALAAFTMTLARCSVGYSSSRRPRRSRCGVLAKLVRKASWAVQLNEHMAERGDIVFRHACKLGLCPSGSARPMCPAPHGIGSRARTRRHRR
jgi:hypothetical protein